MTAPPYERLSRFLELLDERCDYAVVKNPDLWGNLKRGGDWDLLVSDLSTAQASLVEAVGHPRRVARRSYVVSYFFDWGEIDLLPRLEWRGVRLIATHRFLDRAARDPNGWRVACPAHQAIMGWIYPLLSSRSFNEKYVPVVRNAVAVDGVELESRLVSLLGETLGKKLWNQANDPTIGESVKLADSMRVEAWKAAFRHHPFMTSNGLPRLRPPRGATSGCGRRSPFLLIRSAATAEAARAWCDSRRTTIPGLAIFDGAKLWRWPADGLAMPSPDWFEDAIGAHVGSGRLRARDRVAIAQLQSQGWLTASLGKAGGARFTRSGLIGKPIHCNMAREPLGEQLDRHLARAAKSEMEGLAL